MIVQPFPPKLVVQKVDGQTQELFMSFALLNRLTTLVGGAEGVLTLVNDSELQQSVIIEVLTVRKKGEPEQAPLLEDIELTLDSVGDVLDWVGGHISNFLLQRAEKTTQAQAALMERASKLTAIQNGLADLNSPKPAA